MRAHSIEPKTLHVRTQQRLSSEAPEAYNSVCGFFPKAEKEAKQVLRRCESAAALAKRPKSSAHAGTQRLSQLEAKYRALEEDYRKVLQEVRSRTEQFCKQRDEIEKLTLMTQKEEKEITRLKQMLQMTEKRNCGVQTEEEDSSWRKRVEVSTGESELTSETRCERTNDRRSQSRDKAEFRKTATVFAGEKQKVSESRLLRMSTNNGKEKAPLTKKYKFIPTLNFRHN